MSSASLAVRRHAHPDSTRIAALSAAIAINLIALLALLRPMAPQLAEQVRQFTETDIRFLTPPPKVPDPPAVEMKPLPQPRTIPRPHTPPMPPAVPVTAPTSEGNIAAPPAVPTVAPTNPEPLVSTAPVEASLAYRAVPLKYPSQALRGRMQGTVILKVLVDEHGAPQEVTIEQSSGFSLLDRSAREQVLQGWKFEPAMVGGHAVRAWARVPVTFDLNQL